MSILTRSVLDHQEMAYVKTAMEYNDQVIKGGIKPCLAERFAQTAKGFNDKVCVSERTYVSVDYKLFLFRMFRTCGIWFG